MVSVMNDTNRIPNAVSTRTYTPQFSEYQVGCGMMNFNVIYYGNDKFLINQGGCANVYYGFYNTFEGLYNKSTIVNMANDRRSYKIPIIYQKGMFLQETAAALYFTYANTTCGLYEVVDNTILLHTPTDGLTSSPTTWTSRCALPTGEIMISSFTRIKFFVTEVQRFKTVSSSMFSDDVELVNDMATSIMKAGNNTFQFVELKLGNTSIEAVECITLNLGNASLSAICSYNSVNNILSSPQELNPAISSARRGAPIAALPLNGLAGDTSSSNLFIAISHIPIKSNSSIQQISIPEAKNASSAAAHYIALLGQNIYMDWYTSKMYAIYNIVDIEEGLEIPLWLIIVVFISMLFCTVLCCSTQFLLEPLYTGSLYKVMSIQMAPRSSSFASIVRWSKDYPIEYEGFHTTTGNNGFYEVDLKPETTLTQLS
ncbi:hypothetical protein BGZ46_007562 [Entomortierella lignicola]|nr:hypothetical protein BGZ46_007562 [Entomortierella lignicola]